MVALAARMVARARLPLRWPRLAAPGWLAALLAEEARGLALWLPVAFGAGIALYLALLAEPDPRIGLVAAALSLAVLVAARRVAALRLVATGALAAALGFTTIQIRTAVAPATEPLPTRAVVLEARVADVAALPQGQRATLADAMWEGRSEPFARTLRLRLRANDPTILRPGDRIRIRALLRPPSAPAEPGAFDFQRAAFFAGEAGFGIALGPVEVLRHAEADDPASLGGLFARLRADVVQRTRAALPGADGAIAAALLTGQQAGIGQADAQAMRDSGLSHLLSVSGLHISIVMGTVFFMLRFLLALWERAALRLPIKAIALVAGLAAGGFYMGLTGSEVPMQRSFLMAALVVLALLAGRSAISLRALGLAALVVLAIRPDALASASFQMSFAAVAALIAGFEALRWRLPRWLEHAGVARRVLMVLAGLVATSVLASLATAPYAAFHFQRASLYGVAANALAVPLTSFLVMPAGICAMLLMPLGLEAIALVPMGYGCAAILAIAHEVASWPGAAPSLPAMPPWGLMACTLGLLLLCLLRTRLRLIGAPLFLLGMVSPAWHTPPDVVVSADARIIAVNHAGRMHYSRAQGAGLFPLEISRRRAGDPPLEPITCTEAFCRIGDVAIVPQGRAPFGLCGNVPVVVGHEPLRTRCRGSIAVDRFDVWRDGPHAVWLTPDGPVVLSDRKARGERPWVPPRPAARGAAPPALTE
jgi:competence protein ComEC